MKEQWMYLKEDPTFLVSNLGRVKSLDKLICEAGKNSYKVSGRVYKTRVTPNGYAQVCLRINKKYKYFYNHRLVAEYFLDGLDDTKEVNHIDGNKLNNDVRNLEIVTRKENARHAKENRLYSSGSKHGLTKLTEFQVKHIRDMCRSGLSNKDIAEVYNLTTKYVWAITTHRTWKYLEDSNENVRTN